MLKKGLIEEIRSQVQDETILICSGQNVTTQTSTTTAENTDTTTLPITSNLFIIIKTYKIKSPKIIF
jgi:hypothetical protein